MESNFKHDGTSAMVAIDPKHGGLSLYEEVVLEGSAILNSFVHGSKQAKVFSIRLTMLAGSPFSYTLLVDGQGPEGAMAGNWYLHFTYATGKTETLKLYSHTRKTHTIGYNGDAPRITKIRWSDS